MPMPSTVLSGVNDTPQQEEVPKSSCGVRLMSMTEDLKVYAC